MSRSSPCHSVVPSLPLPVVCVVMMAAIHHPGYRGSSKGSLILGYYIVKVKILKSSKFKTYQGLEMSTCLEPCSSFVIHGLDNQRKNTEDLRHSCISSPVCWLGVAM